MLGRLIIHILSKSEEKIKKNKKNQIFVETLPLNLFTIQLTTLLWVVNRQFYLGVKEIGSRPISNGVCG
jgi:hypothetical protein